MGFLDSAGLARFTAWVKGRLAGKLDKTGGAIGEMEQFSIVSGAPESGALTSELAVGRGEVAIKAVSHDPDGEPDSACTASVSQDSFYLGFGGKGYYAFTPDGIMGQLMDGTSFLLDSTPATKNDINNAMNKAAKMASGSYTGNGDYMSPTVVEIGFRPKFFVCTEKRWPFVSFPVESGEQVPYNHLTWFDGMDVYTICVNGLSKTFPIAAAETGISFGMMAASRASVAGWAIAQLNADGVEYGWFAVG